MTLARGVWGFVESRDHRVMRRVNRWRAPRWIRWWMLTATRLGDGWLWYALGVALLNYGGPKRYAAVGSAGFSACIGIMLFMILKRACHRKRPCEIEPHCWAIIRPPDQFSFPSGHSITAFAVAISLSFFYPEFRTPLLVIAASVAASRIILGMHFLSDVIAGGVIGSALALFTHYLFY
jgi:undecaprenyl-diphosphatase